MSNRTALVLTFSVLAIALLVVVLVWTPWTTLPLHGAAAVRADPSRDFTAAQLAKENAYHAAVRPPAYLSLALGLVVAIVLGLTPLGARIVSAVAAPLGGGWGWRVLLGTIALTAIGRLVVLPFDARAEAAQRRFGLSAQTWSSWAVDVAKGYAVGLVVTLLVLFGIVGLARWSPQWWWSYGAVLGALLVVVISFAYPVVVEPVFNSFKPMPAGPLAHHAALDGRARRSAGPRRARRRRVTAHELAERLRVGVRRNPTHRRLRHAAQGRETR